MVPASTSKEENLSDISLSSTEEDPDDYLETESSTQKIPEAELLSIPDLEDCAFQGTSGCQQSVPMDTGTSSSGTSILRTALESGRASVKDEATVVDANTSARTHVIVASPKNNKSASASNSPSTSKAGTSATEDNRQQNIFKNTSSRLSASPKRKQANPVDDDIEIISASKVLKKGETQEFDDQTSPGTAGPKPRPKSADLDTFFFAACHPHSKCGAKSIPTSPFEKTDGNMKILKPHLQKYDENRYKMLGLNIAAKFKLIPCCKQQFVAESIIHSVLAEALLGKLTLSHRVMVDPTRKEENDEITLSCAFQKTEETETID